MISANELRTISDEYNINLISTEIFKLMKEAAHNGNYSVLLNASTFGLLFTTNDQHDKFNSIKQYFENNGFTVDFKYLNYDINKVITEIKISWCEPTIDNNSGMITFICEMRDEGASYIDDYVVINNDQTEINNFWNKMYSKNRYMVYTLYMYNAVMPSFNLELDRKLIYNWMKENHSKLI